MHTHHHDTARGLLHSLASSIEPPAAGRRARRKIDGASNRAELDALLADLLDASDDLAGCEDDSLLDPDFDNL